MLGELCGQGSLSFQILGNTSEFQRVVEVLQDNVDFDIDVNASVFETNIRGERCLLGPVREALSLTTKMVNEVFGSHLSRTLVQTSDRQCCPSQSKFCFLGVGTGKVYLCFLEGSCYVVELCE